MLTIIRKWPPLYGAFLLGAILICHSAFAKLGEDFSSVARDAKQLGAAVQTEIHPKYRMDHLRTKEKHLVHYSTLGGNKKVFAIGYDGPPTNYENLMSPSYANEFIRAIQTTRDQKKRRVRSRALSIRTKKMRITASRYMGRLKLQACIFSELPQGVKKCP